MALDVKAHGVTDVGKKRKRNEDSYIVAPEIGLYAVADGMGGHSAGDVASARAVEVVRASLARNVAVLVDFANDPSPDRGAAAARQVEQAIQSACADIFHAAEADPRLRGMGTTFVCLVVAGDRAVVAHVGDSRLYLYRRGALHVLTEDHTLIAEQIKAGEITPEGALNSPFKGVLTRALGQNESVQVDSLVVDLYPGDAFLLCSDGLHGYLPDDELQQRFGAGAAEGEEQLAAGLVATANERGGRDNITALVVSAADPGEQAAASEARIDFLRRIPLFDYLTYREQNEVISVAHTRTFPAGATVVCQGEPGGDLFVLLEGSVSVERSGLAIATLEAGGHFGEMGLVDAGPRSASVRALTPLRAMVIHRDAVLALMQREPTLAVKLLWAFVQVLSQRLRATNTELSEVLSGPETSRL
jgi:serine/threonine protein phosphatase PrpC